MATIKAYTNLEQSRKLAEILPLESANAYYLLDPTPAGNIYHLVVWRIDFGVRTREPEYDKGDIPCWSLAALLDVLESEIDGEDGETYQLKIEKDGIWWNIWYEEQYDEANPIETESTENLVDACVEIILKLKEQNLL